MKAVVYHVYGPPDVLQLEEVEKPTPKDNELLVKVHAAAINSWDWDLMRGDLANRIIFGGFRKPKLKIIGCDIAGRVEVVGKEVTRFQPGDEVFGDISGVGWGGFAEYVCAREDVLARKSAHMTFEQAAAIPQAGVLALQGLRDIVQIQPGQKVLINGGGGGVGAFGIQLAKLYGAEVTGVDSTEKLVAMRSWGADHVIDYTQADFTQNGQQYDLILDNVARRSVSDYKRALSPTGTFVMIGGSMPLIFQVLLFGRWLSNKNGQQITALMHQPRPADLEHMAELFEADKVVPVIDRCYPLSEVPEAMRYFGESHYKGKVIITMEHDDVV